MKRLFCLSLCVFALSGCADEVAPHLSTQTAPLTPVTLTNYQPLQRVGCEMLATQTANPIALYFEAIDAPTVRVDLARQAIGTLHRHLFCMNTRDFVTNYHNIVAQLEQQAELRQYDTKLAPLAMILAESGGRYVDTRMQSLLARFAPRLLQERTKQQVVAGGIGMFYRRGISAVALSDEQLDLLISSMDTYSFQRSSCGFHQAVFFEFEEHSSKHAYVCLNDSCPIFDDDIKKIDISSTDKYEAFCRTQRGRLDGLKRTGGGGTGSGGSSSTMPSYKDTRSGLAQCVNQYSHAGRYGCFVEASAGDRSVNALTNVINTRFDLELRPKGCGDPAANTTSGFTDQTAQRLRELKKELERLDEEIRQIQERLRKFRNLKYRYEQGEDICEKHPSDACQKMLDKTLEDMAKESGTTAPVDKSKAEKDLWIQKQQSDMRGQDIDAQIKRKDMNKEIRDLERQRGPGTYPHPGRPHFGGCGDGDAPCSDTCDIQSQVDLFENTSRCVGMYDGQSDIPQNNDPLPDPTVMYPSPDAVHASAAFIGLANCVAGVTGAAPINTPQPGGLHCGSQVLCNDASETISDDARVCSCKMQASLPDKFKQVGWEIVSRCNQTIMCTGESATCSCNGLINADNPKKVGGVPTDPTVFLMVNYDVP